MCVQLLVVCGLASNRSTQQMHTTAADETKDSNDANAPATSSAEWGHCICSAVTNIRCLSFIFIHNKKTRK